MSTTPSPRQPITDFERQAELAPGGLFGELLGFLRQNKKWWLVPVIVALLLIGALVVLGGTAVAPFIYTLF